MTKETLRLRVFAGPNGSGKSTIIDSVRNFKTAGIPVDFGIYVNADEIAQNLLMGSLSFKDYEIKVCPEEFNNIAINSGLINEYFSVFNFRESFKIEDNRLFLLNTCVYERLAQTIAHVLRELLLKERKKFSFETVFSHQGKIDFMERACEQGYKVYLYFVSTEDPQINVYRVKKVRVKQKGHDVPEEKIVDRYYRSMDFLFNASQYAYQSFFFDNSRAGERFNLFAHFKLDKNGKKIWDSIDTMNVPIWFAKYYSKKVKPK